MSQTPSSSSSEESDVARSVPMRIAVIGGGISGLVAAREASRLMPSAQVRLFEASDRVGGLLQTTRQGPWLIEHSADMMATKPVEGWELCRELGMLDEMVPTDKERRGALVYREGKLYPVPEGFSLMAPASIAAILKSRLLSWRGKLRLARERWVAARQDVSDESFESFAIRRCGREAYEYLIQPLVSGIYTADPKKLSMQATSLSRFVSMEKEYGSLSRGMLKTRRQAANDMSADDQAATGARYGMFVAPRDGMQQLIDRIAKALPGDAIRLRSPVTGLRSIQQENGWEVQVGDQNQTFDRVIVATSAGPAAQLLDEVDAELSRRINSIEHASCAVVVLGFVRPSRIPKAFGLVVPDIESRPMIAASFSSNKFPGRAPAAGLLVRVFFGGALNEVITRESDESLVELALRELQETAQVSGQIELSQVVRWNRAMPQYHVGHLQNVAAIQKQLEQWPTLAVTGNSYRGVGIPDCVREGRLAAQKICG